MTVLSPRGDFQAHPQATDDPGRDRPGRRRLPRPQGLLLRDRRAAPGAAAARPDTAVVAAQNGVPWWYFHRHGGPYDGRRIEAVDPGGATSAAIAARARDRLRRLLLDRARGAGRRAPRRGHALLARRARPQRLRTLPAAFARRSSPAASRRPSSPICATRSGSSCSATPSSTRSACSRARRSPPCAATRGTRALARDGMEECARDRARARLATRDRRSSAASHGAERVGEHRTSTLQDLDAGKRLELDALIVAVVELAELTGTPAPTLHALAAESTAAGR